MITSIDCSPDTSIIASYKQAALGSFKAIAEIVDNSLDAGANQVSIEWDKKANRLRISDDGRGCRDPEVMAKLGGSFKQAGSGVVLGRYGIGLKEASVWLCDKMTVTSRYEGVGFRIVVDWAKIQKTKQWSVPVEKLNESESSGVSIEMESVRKIAQPTSDKTIESLSETFRPAILSGRQIVIQGKPLAAFDLPLLKDQVDTDGTFDGKAYNAKFGIKADKSNGYGWTIAYGHRVLTTDYTRAGFGEYSPSRFYGYITLYDTGESKWSLNRFKDGFDGIDALLDSLADQIAPLLKRAEAEGLDLEIKTAAGNIEDELNQVFGYNIQEKRPGTAGEEGSVEPRNTGRRRVEARQSDPERPGSVTPKCGSLSKFKVSLDWDREGEIGNVTAQGKILRIHLNPNHPHLTTSKLKENDMRSSARSLLAAYCAFTGNRQLLLRLDEHTETGNAFDSFRAMLGTISEPKRQNETNPTK